MEKWKHSCETEKTLEKTQHLSKLLIGLFFELNLAFRILKAIWITAQLLHRNSIKTLLNFSEAISRDSR